jgi:hypothetical protein
MAQIIHLEIGTEWSHIECGFGNYDWAIDLTLRITEVEKGLFEQSTLVVSRLAGNDKPMVLLMNLPVENLADAKRVLRLYIRRWECEEGIRFLKSQVSLEKIRTFRWSAIGRLVLLAVLVTIYLG